MSLLADLKMYARFAGGLRGFLRQQITLAEAGEMLRRRVAEREANFLRLIERGVFGYGRSPYRPLLQLAGCELSDITAMVRAKGIEATLEALHAAGVYFTFEEFKGRQPVVRQGREIAVRPEDFDNPYLSHYYYAASSGSTGAGTRIPIDLANLAERAAYALVASDAYGLTGAPTAQWRGVMPSAASINGLLTSARTGNVMRKWFTPVLHRDLRPSLTYRLATQYIITVGRLSGVPLPRPEPVPLDRAEVIARWAADMVRIHGRCSVKTFASMALRICLSATEAGIDLTGVTLSGGGEPMTQTKMAHIRRAGARAFPTYHFSEAGAVGMSCAQPIDENDQHFFKDGLALIQYPREVPGVSGVTVDAFCFTSLLPTTPKLLLNVESDDYGVMEARTCGCPFEAYGFTQHIRHIRSFRKLSGEGMTLVGSEMIQILEDVLPARFGGTAQDYQLREEEDARGFTRLSLLVHPRVAVADENALIGTILTELGKGRPSADMARAIWGQARTLQVKREAPVWTAAGKLMPLHLMRRTAPVQRGASDG